MAGDAHGVAEDHGFDVAVALDIDSADQRSERSGAREMVRAPGADGVADQVQHDEHPASEMRNIDRVRQDANRFMRISDAG